MKLSVIIVNYNVRYFLEQALLSVRKAVRGIEAEVFVVDNNSVDDSVAMVREKFPEVHLIANTDNPGFSIANNQAIHRAKGEYVLLLNPDTVVEEDTFSLCINFMDQHPNAGGLGVKMIDGAGNFLPESKRGFPTPWVAFCKTVGLSSFFPKSKQFNHYHLGYLGTDDVNEVEVLAGAFMMLRKTVLDDIGLLDETFFMYGEDIDLSYRIIKGGYENYYFPETQIIHYKGESTKKGSLNYVKAFYQAMIIFAKKHFTGSQAKLFVVMLQVAIYFRALIALVSAFAKKMFLPALDALLLFAGLYFIKDAWASYHFDNPDYYSEEILYFNFPLYIAIWVGGIFFSGGYDNPFSIRRLFRGLTVATLLLAATYGFLDLEYRSSRALIILGAAWAFIALFVFRLIWFFLKNKSLAITEQLDKRMIVVGRPEEAQRTLNLLQKAAVSNNWIGRVRMEQKTAQTDSIGHVSQLDEIVSVYKVDEIIFCSKDLATQEIMAWMAKLGPQILYKILPEDSLSIIGSQSKNTAGELYTIDVKFNIAQPLQRRNKRIFDLLVCGFIALTFPLQLILIKRRLPLIMNWWRVLQGKMTWVGYLGSIATAKMLPPSKPAVLTPLDGQKVVVTDPTIIQHLNLLYAKDYSIWTDFSIVISAWKHLGR